MADASRVAESTNPRPRADPRASRDMLGDGSRLTTGSSSDGAGCMTAPQPAGGLTGPRWAEWYVRGGECGCSGIGQAGRAVTVVQPAFAEQPA